MKHIVQCNSQLTKKHPKNILEVGVGRMGVEVTFNPQPCRMVWFPVSGASSISSQSTPSNAACAPQKWWSCGRYLLWQLQYTFFRNILDLRDTVCGPHTRQALKPFVVGPERNPYAGKSCSVHIRTALILN